jgi:hypothetical protein
VRLYARELARQLSLGRVWVPGFGMTPGGRGRAPRGPYRVESLDIERGAELRWTSDDPAAVQHIRRTSRLMTQ